MIENNYENGRIINGDCLTIMDKLIIRFYSRFNEFSGSMY